MNRVPDHSTALSEADVVSKVAHLGDGATSANAIFVNPFRAYALSWYPNDSPHADYYTLWRLEAEVTTYIASEPVSHLGRFEQWQPLPRGRLIEFPLRSLASHY